MENSRMRAENRPRREEEVGKEEGRMVPVESWKEGEVRKSVLLRFVIYILSYDFCANKFI